MGYSADGVPHVGAVPGRENQWVIAGFTGHGMPQAFLSARGLVPMILQEEGFESTGVPKIFKASRQRLSNSRNTVLETWETIQQGEGKPGEMF